MEKKVKPEDLSTDTPPPRIIGTECEYSIQGLKDIGKVLNSETVSKIGLISLNEFVQNGARMYVDLGRFLEYAGPESLGPADATVSDFAGVETVVLLDQVSDAEHDGIYRQTGSFMPSEYLNPNTTRGYHENYLSTEEATDSKYFKSLFPSFLATKTWDGQGTLRTTGYVLKQKIWANGKIPIVYKEERRTSASNKPMVMVKHDDDTVNNGWRRVELRCVDGGLSKEARLVAFGATSLVLRLFEHPAFIDGSPLKDFATLTYVAEAGRVFAKDLLFDNAFSTTNTHKRVTAIDVQECFLDACEKMAESVQLPDDERYALAKWREIIERMKQSSLPDQEYAGLYKICDNVALYHRISQYNEDERNVFNHEAMRVCQNWDRIVPTGSAQAHWARFGSKLVTDEMIEDRIYNTPNSRAARRVETMQNPSVGNVWWGNYSRKTGGKLKSLGNAY